MHQNTRKILDAIRAHLKRHGYSPSIAELMDATGIRSSSTVSHHLARLRALNLITWTPKANRTIRLTERPQTLAEEILGPEICKPWTAEELAAAQK